MTVRDLLVRNSLKVLTQGLMTHHHARGFLLKQVEKALHREALHSAPGGYLTQVQRDRLDCTSALLHGLDRLMRHGMLSSRVADSVVDAFLGNVLLNQDSARAAFELGFEPPSFITISPSGKCNLKCKGCYASDAALKGGDLDFRIFDRILREKREMWGSRFTVISGGEPFLWKDQGYDILKLAEKHRGDIFMVYTNGTLIDDDMARRIAEVGNITPSISIEGFEAETDARRGKGVHAKIMRAMENLRNHGIPFGFSATATRDNWDLIVSDEFIDFYYFDQCAVYGWIFQYMPIGRDQTLDMVVPPTARLQMMEKMWRLVREQKVFMVDFWNSGTASYGCISAGRGSGYFYINWDGDIMPCVFTPYAADNVYRLYARGDNLNAAIQSPLFRKMRDWQRDYGYEKPMRDTDNWLCPCAIRDHFDDFAQMVKDCGGRPINQEARDAMQDPAYRERMIAYGQEIAKLTDPIWQSMYLRPPD